MSWYNYKGKELKTAEWYTVDEVAKRVKAKRKNNGKQKKEKPINKLGIKFILE